MITKEIKNQMHVHELERENRSLRWQVETLSVLLIITSVALIVELVS